jgi:hypothetical protein
VRRPYGRLAVLLVLAFASEAPAAPAAATAQRREVYVPQWKVGQAWVVELEPRDPLALSRFPWEPPKARRKTDRVRFRFVVDKVQDAKGLRLFLVKVRGLGGVSSEADVVFGGQRSAGGVKSLFVLKAEYRYRVKGLVNQVRRDYNRQSTAPFPVVNDVNNVPVDFPYLYRDHGVDPAKPADGFFKEFDAVESVGGDLRSRAMRQTVLFPPPKVKLPVPSKLVMDSDRHQDIYLKALSSGAVVRFVFHPAYPWPVYAEGPRGRSWLVEVEKGERGKKP